MLVTQSCPTLCDPTDWGPPGFSMGFFQARRLEWVAISFSNYIETTDIKSGLLYIASKYVFMKVIELQILFLGNNSSLFQWPIHLKGNKERKMIF